MVMLHLRATGFAPLTHPDGYGAAQTKLYLLDVTMPSGATRRTRGGGEGADFRAFRGTEREMKKPEEGLMAGCGRSLERTRLCARHEPIFPVRRENTGKTFDPGVQGQSRPGGKTGSSGLFGRLSRSG